MRRLISITMQSSKSILWIILTVVALGALVFAILSSAAEDDYPSSPKAVTEAFYDEWVNAEENPVSSQLYEGSEYVTQVFVENTNKAVSSFESGRYDPVLCAQDVPSSYTVSTRTKGEQEAETVVSEVFGDTAKSVNVKLVRHEGLWQIQEIICPEPEVSEEEFNEAGNLVKDNPGLEPGVWYLSYEKPGKPALTKKLVFVESSTCIDGSEDSGCSPEELIVGSRVRITGSEEGGAVVVSRLELVE